MSGWLPGSKLSANPKNQQSVTKRQSIAQVFDRLLDILATRWGLTAGTLLLMTVCVWAGVNVERTTRQLETNRQVFLDQEMRTGFVAMSDVQRLVLVAQAGAAMGGFTPELERDFRDAADIIFVRKDSFRRATEKSEPIASAGDVITSLEEIVLLADSALQEGLNDAEGVRSALLESANTARQSLVIFLDDMRRAQDRLLESGASAVSEQRMVVFISLSGLTLLGLVGVFLLRREVRFRHGRERAEKDVKFLAFFDPLTRLPNRAQFQQELGAALKEERQVSLILIDLDDFKTINDTYGHAVGDSVLAHAAFLLQAATRHFEGFAARIGGDEFAIVAHTDDIELLKWVCDDLLAAMNKPLPVEGEDIRMGASMGLAIRSHLGPDQRAEVDDLSRLTDFALYTSKSNGRGRLTIYDKDLEAQFLERRAMVDDLPGAISNRELEMFLQPKVSLPEREVFGFEALVRWRRDGRIVAPDRFISVAEESGVIFEIDRFVLTEATHVFAAYNRDHQCDLSVSVNLSALHFSSRRIVGWVREALEQSGLRPDLLILEITESAEVRDWEQAQSVIAAVRELGAKMSVDDFGTGYSSIQHLRSATTDEIKIDRSIISGIERSQKQERLVAGLLGMARGLGLDVVVEGIETEEQAEIVTRLGGTSAQGYLFGHPLPAEEALEGALAVETAWVAPHRKSG